MFNKIKTLKPDNQCLVYFIITFFVVFIILLPFSIIFNLYGLIIGWAIGGIVAAACLKLIFKSAEVIIAQKVKSGFAVLFYTIRMLLFISALVLCAVMQWVVKCEPFYWSIFTCAACYLPMLFLIPFINKEGK